MQAKLWDHQQKAVDLARDREYFGFLFDCGTGKSLACISTIREIFNSTRAILPTLILAPVIVLENWKDEWLKFSKIPEDRIVILNSSVKKALLELEQNKNRLNGFMIVVSNYEKLVVDKRLLEWIQQWRPRILVVDESQRIKNPSSKRTKAAISLADIADYRYILSGTPILNNPMDIFSQWRVLDRGTSFGKNFFSFRLKYFYDKNANMPKQNYFPNWVIKPSAYDEISKEIKKNSLRARKEDCLDLPPLVKTTISVDLSPCQRRLYNEMKEDMVTMFQDTTISANIALTKILRLLQIITGFVKNEDEKILELDEVPRLHVLQELLEDITPNHKVIVWCIFKHNYKQIREVCDKIGVKYVECHGELSNKDKYESVSNFCNIEDYRVFIGHPASLGVGINLTESSYSIIYSRSWSLEMDLQSEARNYRAGSEIHQKITKIDLVAKDTIDETILEILEQKMNNAEKILGTFKKHLGV